MLSFCILIIICSVGMVNCSSSTAGVDNTVVHQQTTTIIPDNDVDNNTEDESLLQFTPFILRLHLIRHGETIANVQNIVLGQGDSPLTDNGLILAQMASAQHLPNVMNYRFHNIIHHKLVIHHNFLHGVGIPRLLGG